MPDPSHTLTHIDNQTGDARMVDVSGKDSTARQASAECVVLMQASTLEAIQAGQVKKGEVFGTARLAGIMGAKRTSDLIPLCHPLPLTSIDVDIVADPTLPGCRITASARVTGKTGVEMEALTAVSIAALTLYDMAKALDKGMQITGQRLLAKSGGASGDWSAS
ncbi:MAG: cyclic pyranopterin monophosphate synthase MoaC [Alphaproteobacteria bacterium]